MKYGIIVCPKCKRSKAVNLSNKTTKCIRCGKVLTLDKIRILYKTNSETDLQNKIYTINKKLDNSTK
ncbi:hypothetical protein AYK20_07720 [Thermoplasmatales archaeon SG8-52-1]|nr:MAG: hypothetical protein AYK20_07720 [Thermoplasmatales archaeon SG8-52-1]